MKKLAVIVVTGISFLLLLGTIVYASSYVPGHITLECDGWVGDGANVWIFDRFNIDNNTAAERFTQEVRDGAGTVLWENANATVPHGLWGTGGPVTYTTLPQYNPLTMNLYSLEGNGLPQVLVGTETGNCAGLPTYVAPTPEPGVTPTATAMPCPVLPSNAVVGSLQFSTPAFYEPGKEAVGVTVNAGTYWVLGVDETGEYYKIQIACEHLWLPVGVLQPSFESPWSGQPLPTNVVGI